MTRTLAFVGIAGAVLLAVNGMAQTPTPPPAPPPSTPTMSPSSSMPGATGQHTMTGEVTKVDARKGWVDVKTPEGRMKLHYPPPALDQVKVGDRVTVELSLDRGAK